MHLRREESEFHPLGFVAVENLLEEGELLIELCGLQPLCRAQVLLLRGVVGLQEL